MCVCVSPVTKELVRLTTENSYLTQSKEEMKNNVDRLSQRVASMVSIQPSVIYSSYHTHSPQHTYVMAIQWNPSNLDTNGAEESAIVSEVSSFKRLKCMQEWMKKVSCLEIEALSVQGVSL